MTTSTKTTKKTATSTKDVAEKNGRTPKFLRAPQVRILTFLSKNGKPASEQKIVEKAPVDRAWLPDSLYGRIADLDEKVKEIKTTTPSGSEREKKIGYKSLLGLGFVRGRVVDVDGKSERLWEITASGKKALTTVDA